MLIEGAVLFPPLSRPTPCVSPPPKSPTLDPPVLRGQFRPFFGQKTLALFFFSPWFAPFSFNPRDSSLPCFFFSLSYRRGRGRRIPPFFPSKQTKEDRFLLSFHSRLGLAAPFFAASQSLPFTFFPPLGCDSFSVRSSRRERRETLFFPEASPFRPYTKNFVSPAL